MKIISHITPEMVINIYNSTLENYGMGKRIDYKFQLCLSKYIGNNIDISSDKLKISNLHPIKLKQLYNELLELT